MKKVLFIDRDGTLIIEPADEQIDSLEKLEFYPGVIVNLHKISKDLDFELVMVSNQDGLGSASFPEDTFWPAHNKMMKTLDSEGIQFSDILIDSSLPQENSPNRKPGTGMLKEYQNGEYDLANSFVIGDRMSDVQLAKNLGAKSILISDREDAKADFVTDDWSEIYSILRFPDRVAELRRTTHETDIFVRLNLDGNGQAKLNTGIGFFDHMLELFAKHSMCDLTVDVKGDLNVDEHHSVEDTAIVIGELFLQALGNKKGIERYGFLLPMDESIAQVAIDFSGRNELQWKTKFKRERIGEMPTEMFYHFFKSFSDSAKCNLYIKAKGKNEHHKIEGIFKAVARSIKMAVKRDSGNQQIPSTKGLL
ncbi:MAG: bifunctional histidinol-phosphatase/imidazoleglycerol-phosphate dehydratase HisB [Calditrichaeota bacterium]|nr:MAG: bifunctional histidinol-phosphatase/imidazoleglycerol-phosphate dehydratase HisB [Calditrichota bacterium]MBL1205618.1 bifunctional histidinol-phosphatase/imidazoleglycerol-phosphate dehydratase HisB [Calditrichota bacterium]NOG45446.1 bifunctional histidinol-phosphatase/imidazoleglycerol-phosphate dehydratase HisB [Calditrichota bacterium]